MATYNPTLHNQQPKSGLAALFDQIYEIKFNKHVPLAVVMLSTVYTVYRTHHYLGVRFKLEWYISFPTSFFIELLVLGASAMLFIALRADYIANITKQDADLTNIGVKAMFVTLAIAFAALLGLASADAWLLTGEVIPAFVMTLVQAAQMLFICGFIINATIDEREQIRNFFDELGRTETSENAGKCPYCFKPVSPNNRKRHMDACPMKP